MRRKFGGRIFAWICVFVLVLGTVPGVMPIHAESSSQERLVSRRIHVVYDDSNSMLMDQRPWWSYAKYSLEIFSAMMQDKDSMSIYYMSDGSSNPRLEGLSGEKSQQQDNINDIHRTVTDTAGTPFSSIDKAYRDLKLCTGYDEKWLVVITDGDAFNNNETASDLDGVFGDNRINGIKVIYLAIGDNAITPSKNEARGIFVHKADGDTKDGENGILAQVTQICQRIFERPAVKNTASSQLVLDIPVSEIIVLAQGSSVSVGDLPGTRKTVSDVEIPEDAFSTATIDPTYGKPGQIKNPPLNASIATFTPKRGEYIAEGSYDLLISADSYTIYYKPCLDVILELYDSQGNRVTDKYIPLGSYRAKYWLTYPEGHPKHGEELQQNLFDVAYTLTCEAEGAVRELQSDNIDLTAGEITIRVVADYLNYSSSDASLKYVVEDFTINPLEVTLEYLQQDYLLSTLETDNEGILVKVTRNGEPLPALEWERFTLKLSIDNPDFKIVKSADSTFMIYPRYKDGDRAKTATGEIPFNVNVSASNDHRVTDSGTAPAVINIYDDITAVLLGVTIDDQHEPLDNINFPDQDSSRKVTIDWNGNPLRPEQYAALKLTVDINDRDFSAAITLDQYVEGQLTTATIIFTLVPDEDGNPPKQTDISGTKRITVDAEIDHEGQISRGRATGKMKIGDERPFWIKWGPWIIVLLSALVLFIFYSPFTKKYLPFVSTYRYGIRFVNSRKIYWWGNLKTLGSLICPISPMTSRASIHTTRGDVSIEVVAQGGKRVKVKKSDQLLGGKVPLIDDMPMNESDTSLSLNNGTIGYGVTGTVVARFGDRE